MIPRRKRRTFTRRKKRAFFRTTGGRKSNYGRRMGIYR